MSRAKTPRAPRVRPSASLFLALFAPWREDRFWLRPKAALGTPRLWGGGSCETKPSGGQDILLFPDFPYTIIPPSQSCLVCQTNPISGRPERRLTAAGEKSYDGWDLERASENKANSGYAGGRGTRGKCAKRTQSGSAGPGALPRPSPLRPRPCQAAYAKRGQFRRSLKSEV
jgi:hypothetical protein